MVEQWDGLNGEVWFSNRQGRQGKLGGADSILVLSTQELFPTLFSMILWKTAPWHVLSSISPFLQLMQCKAQPLHKVLQLLKINQWQHRSDNGTNEKNPDVAPGCSTK